MILSNKSPVVSQEADKIFKLKYLTNRFNELDADVLQAHAIGIILQICVVTGWKLPEMKEMQTVLYNQFKEFLLEQWADYNPEEIQYAIRTYGTRIEDWGKNINLNLITKVLDIYAKDRKEVSELEERGAFKKETPKPALEMPKECDWSEQINDLKEKAKNGKIERAIIPEAIYGWLEKQGSISLSKEEKDVLMKQAHTKWLAELHEMQTEGRMTPQLNSQLLRLKEKDWLTYPDLKSKCAIRAKKLAVINHIKQVANL